MVNKNRTGKRPEVPPATAVVLEEWVWDQRMARLAQDLIGEVEQGRREHLLRAVWAGPNLSTIARGILHEYANT